MTLARDGRGRFAAARALQSWPGIVHGGGLVALLDAAAVRLGAPAGPRRLEGRLTSPVPVETALELEGHRTDDTVTVTILQDSQPLIAGAVTPLPAGEPRDLRAWQGEAAAWPGVSAGWTLPMSEDCLACGARNPLGLQLALRFDEEGVWARLTPRDPWWEGPGGLHPAMAPVLLDEVAWWLGALTMREGGLTNRLSITLLRPDARPAGGLLGAGRFADVKPVDRKRTFWRTASALMTAEGLVVATASIVFRGGPDYSTRQMEYFRPRTPPEVFSRMFPNHAR